MTHAETADSVGDDVVSGVESSSGRDNASATSDSENPYILLTPGPLSTSRTVKAVMMRDWCTWDDDYNVNVVQSIRRDLVGLASGARDVADRYTSVLMQGSGTFCVESVIGSAVPDTGKLLILANGAYGQRLAQISRVLRIATEVYDSGELDPPDPDRVDNLLKADPSITHVAMVHGETTTGMLNPIDAIGQVARSHGKIFIVDAMSTFGGVPLDMEASRIDFLISSANKCIQGVPGFGFIIARTDRLESCRGRARSLSLDLHSQWKTMEDGNGKWRYTSPTHTVRAFAQALMELAAEGGIARRHERYRENHRILISGMEEIGFECLLKSEHRSPIITAFRSPSSERYEFKRFYDRLKDHGFVIYPGKVTDVDTFRIGTIGHVFPEDFRRLIAAIRECRDW